jgi:hypothetical protein
LGTAFCIGILSLAIYCLMAKHGKLLILALLFNPLLKFRPKIMSERPYICLYNHFKTIFIRLKAIYLP